jgi:hypothetical protein
MIAKARTMGRAVVACLSCVLWALAPWTARADDWTVHTSVELHAALGEAASNGEDDTITIAGGTYQGPFYFNPQDSHSLVLRGEGTGDPAQVVLEGVQSPHACALGMSCGPAPGARVVVRDLTLQGGYYSGFTALCQSGALDLALERVVVQDNTALDNGGGALLQAIGPGSLRATLRNCVIRDNQAPGQEGRGGRGGGLLGEAYGGGARLSLTLVNTLVYGNRSNWSGGGLSLMTQGPPLDNELQATLVNTTITGNRTGMHGTFQEGGGLALYARPAGVTSTVTMYNTVLYGNQSGPGAGGGDDLYTDVGDDTAATVEALFCDVGERAIDVSSTYTETQCQHADPLFRNAAGGDLHLTSQSPCVDAGTAAVPDPPGLPAMDMDGQPRVYGVAPDIGADEFGGEVMLWLPLILKRARQ